MHVFRTIHLKSIARLSSFPHRLAKSMPLQMAPLGQSEKPSSQSGFKNAADFYLIGLVELQALK